MSTHGQLTEDKAGRYCDKHGRHGFLYCCEEYSPALKKQIHELSEKFRQQCADGTMQIVHNYNPNLDLINEKLERIIGILMEHAAKIESLTIRIEELEK
jgi:hypothetical protein